ncbi:MFS transporter [Qaidamihabitans albus]|uniref:MFS transporter n=1 Tax=Qaidamihabitans albus TaxID=2795733 RepID=UPI0018F1AC61|nr:MFS transporter [Qaidamihabitans albus]
MEPAISSSEAASTTRSSSWRLLRRSILASVTGTALEWYDFYLYGTAAALVFSKIFFPSFDPVTGTLLSFATYAVGFGARPIGGFIAGHFGDRWGRKVVLVVTVSTMGIATFLMGLLPSYASIGVAAPVLLVCLRLIQGIGLGGEWAGGALLIGERAPRERRGFWTSFVQVGVPIGSLMSTGILALLSGVLSEEEFLSWGWRIPFLFSAVIVIVALVIRAKVTETPAFLKQASSEVKPSRSPVWEVWRRAPKTIFQVIGIRLGADICYYTFVVFVITYVTTFLGLPESVALRAVLIAGILELFLYPAWGLLSDRFGRKRVTLVGLAGCAVWAVAFFMLLDTRSPVLIVVAVLIGLFFEAAMYGVQAPWICELFDTDVRYSGASIGYQTASIVGGSLAPLIGVALLREFQSPWPVVGYLLLGLAVTLIAVLTTAETRGRDLDETNEIATGKE